VTVTPETKAVDAVIQFCQHPDINTLAVVDKDTKLLGILEIGRLIDDLLADVLPEGYMRSSINRDKMMEASFFLTVHETVEEMMTEPVAITYAYTAEEAFLVLHSNQLRGVPILDENDCVVSYLGLLEFLTLWMPDK
jgi:CBS domain-containing protein